MSHITEAIKHLGCPSLTTSLSFTHRGIPYVEQLQTIRGRRGGVTTDVTWRPRCRTVSPDRCILPAGGDSKSPLRSCSIIPPITQHRVPMACVPFTLPPKKENLRSLRYAYAAQPSRHCSLLTAYIRGIVQDLRLF